MQKIKSQTLSKRYAIGSLWSLLSVFFSQGASFVASIIVARLLGTTGFGEYNMIINTIGTLGTFTGLGLGLTATKYLAELKYSQPERAGRILGLAIQLAFYTNALVAILVFFFAPFLAKQTLNAPYLSTELKIGCLLLFFNSYNGLQTGALVGFESFKKIARITIVSGIINFPILILGTY